MSQIEQTQEQDASQKEAPSADVIPLHPEREGAQLPELDPDTLSKMPASRLGRLLAGQIGEAAVCRDSGIVYQYGGGVWQPISDSRLVPMLAEMFDSVDCPYTARKLSGAVETMKVGLPEMGQPSGGLIGFANGVYDLKAGIFRPHDAKDYLPSHNGITYGEPVPGCRGRRCQLMPPTSPSGWPTRRGEMPRKWRGSRQPCIWCWRTAMTGNCF